MAKEYPVIAVIGTEECKKEMEQRIKGTTGLLALIGSPVGHSGSPAMYTMGLSLRRHIRIILSFNLINLSKITAYGKTKRMKCFHRN